MNRARQAFVYADHRWNNGDAAPGPLFAAADLDEIRRCRLEDAEGPAPNNFAGDDGCGRSGHDEGALKVQLLP